MIQVFVEKKLVRRSENRTTPVIVGENVCDSVHEVFAPRCALFPRETPAHLRPKWTADLRYPLR